MGAWIETWRLHCLTTQTIKSHPVWVRGLKPASDKPTMFDMRVAPRVGAWIETTTEGVSFFSRSVAPRVGAWIETVAAGDTSLYELRRTPCGCVD